MKGFDNYEDSLEWLFRQLPMFSRVGAAAYKPGLERSQALAGLFGNPQCRFKSIHVAGTNGKGSTSNMIAAILQAQGYKTALYTSPHLVDFRERIRINGQMIPRDRVLCFINDWQKMAEHMPDKPSFFELTMMLAFCWFAEQNVDYAVIEVGMGGRLDSTNIITPELSIITNISKDHTQFLGDTPEKIAGEKAGIIKKGIPVVIGEAEESVGKVFRDKAAEMKAPIREAYREMPVNRQDLPYTPLHGDYQLNNINTARVAIDELRKRGIQISDEAEKRGFADVEKLTGFRGRWNIVSQSPLTIADTGHNEAGLKYNMEQLRKIMNERPGGELRIILGFVADKDVEHIIPFFPTDAVYYLTRANIPRALPVENMEHYAATRGWHYKSFPSVAEAYRNALEEAGPDDVIFIGGSTFIVADFFAATDNLI